VRVTTRRIRRVRRGSALVAPVVAICRRARPHPGALPLKSPRGQTEAVAGPFFTYCTCAAGASATCTAPPPITAPPAAQADNFARAIRTDISFALFMLRGNHAGPHACHSTPVPIETQTIGKAATLLTVFLVCAFQKNTSCRGFAPYLSRFETDCCPNAKVLARSGLTFGRIGQIEQTSLRTARRGDSQVLPGALVEAAPAGRARHQTQLDQVGFDHIFNRIARFG